MVASTPQENTACESWSRAGREAGQRHLQAESGQIGDEQRRGEQGGRLADVVGGVDPSRDQPEHGAR